MYILGIDTSFDDTAAAVTHNTQVLSSVLSSELTLYQHWGGVVPKIARQSHEQNIDRVVAKALRRAGITWKEVDVIAVTRGPGLALTLEVGLAKAIDYAVRYKKPVVAVNHLEGHLLSVLARRKGSNLDTESPTLDFPALGVLISGGTTQFIKVKAIGDYELVGETQDDAMGEAFDKAGRMLGLGYPAGALIEKLARTSMPSLKLPIPMRGVKTADTSFSGLKTAVQRLIADKKDSEGKLSRQLICDIALAFQNSCIKHLSEKIQFALQDQKYLTLIVAGGVASNLAVRKELRLVAKTNGLTFLLPYTKKLCVDNAAMIAVAGYYSALKGNFVKDFANLDRLPNMPLGSASRLQANLPGTIPSAAPKHSETP